MLDHLGFNPKREWRQPTMDFVYPVDPAKTKQGAFHDWQDDSPEPWLDAFKSYIVTKKFIQSDKDERREYVLNEMPLSKVGKALQKQLAKLGFRYSFGEAIDSSVDSNGFQHVTFIPKQWNDDAAKLGIVAIEVVHDEGASNLRIIELYGLPTSR